MSDRYEKIRQALSHEIWAAAQLAPGEGIVDGVARVEALLRKAAHPAITHCEGCGCDWLDNGLNPVGCPYCKQPAAGDDVVVERIAALLHEETTGEPWTVAGVEHPGPDRDYYRGLARKVAALAAHRKQGDEQ